MLQFLCQRSGLIVHLRKFRSTAIRRDVKPPSVNNTSAESNNSSILGPQMLKPTNFQKRILVFGKRYPSIADVPDKISVETLKQTQTKARIRVSNMLLVFTALGCVYMIYCGKRDAAKGISVASINKEWHKKINDEYNKSLESQGNK